MNPSKAVPAGPQMRPALAVSGGSTISDTGRASELRRSPERKWGLCFTHLLPSRRGFGRESLVRFEAPQPGSFSEEQVRAAEAKRLAAKAVGKLAEMGSKANRDDPEYQGALHLAGAGARGAEWLAELGPLPINRIDIVVRIADREQVLRFDVMAATKKEMEAEAKQFWSRATNAGR